MSKVREGAISSNIPIPASTRRHKYNFAELKVGDSVWYQISISHLHAVLRATKLKYPERRFVARTENGGTRTWRVADQSTKQEK